MSERRSVTIKVYGVEYSIVSSEDPQATIDYAAHVDKVMRDIAEKTGATDHSRVQMLALLQITHELYSLKNAQVAEKEEYKRRMDTLLSEIDSKISKSGVQTRIIDGS